MEEDYMKTRLRDAIFKEVEKYIGYVYADDYHGNDYLIIRTYDEEVSHGTRSCDEREDGYRYFDMFHLLKKPSTFTFEPDPIGIECVVLHYYPDERVTKIIGKMKNAITKFIKKHGYNAYAKLIIPLDTFESLVDSDGLKTKDGMIKVTEDEYGINGYLEKEIRFLLRRNKQREYTFQEDSLLRIAAELLNYF